MSEHVPRSTYIAVWITLLVLLAITVAASYVHLGWLNPVVALGIAATKATIIAMYFMHLRGSMRLVWVTASIGLIWLIIMFTLTFSDYWTRSYLGSPVVW